MANDNDLFDFEKTIDDGTTKGRTPSPFSDSGFVPVDEPFNSQQPPKRKWGLVLIVVLALAAGGGAFYFFNSGSESHADIPESASEHDDHHYKVYDEALTWTDAKEECENKGGHLATITSKSEQKFISSLIEENGEQKHYWLGGTDENDEDEWEWVTGESFEDYSNWEKGRYLQPNNNRINDPEHGEDYLEIQAVFAPDNPGEYMTWNDTCDTGDAPSNAEEPWYYSNKYFGYICEWDE